MYCSIGQEIDVVGSERSSSSRGGNGRKENIQFLQEAQIAAKESDSCDPRS